MTRIYFVRHAQPVHAHMDDRTRPLSPEGLTDRALVSKALQDAPIDFFYCSPYKRSLDTILPTAQARGMEIRTDERLRERVAGKNSNNHALMRLRWENKDAHEEDGESIRMLQERNIAALQEILTRHPGKTIVIGTHGSALSSIINYYHPEFGADDFFRIIDWMPYILRMDFEGQMLLGMEEIAHTEKVFRG